MKKKEFATKNDLKKFKKEDDKKDRKMIKKAIGKKKCK